MAYKSGRHVTKNGGPTLLLNALTNYADRRPRSFQPSSDRHRHDACREHLHGEEPADTEARDQELEVVEREYLREKALDARHLARVEERKDRRRRARPDEQDGAQSRNWCIPTASSSVVSFAWSLAILAGASATNTMVFAISPWRCMRGLSIHRSATGVRSTPMSVLSRSASSPDTTRGLERGTCNRW